MDFTSKARKLEQRISRTVDAAVVEFVGRSTTSPIEMVHSVLDRAEAEIQEIGRGRRVFPFNRVRVQVIAGDKESRARMAAVTNGPPSLSDRLIDRLRSSGCAIDTLEATVVHVRRRGADWTDAEFHVDFDRTEVSAARPASPDHAANAIVRLKLTVLKGTAEHRTYAFTSGRVDIGRRSDVVDQRQRLIRTNHAAHGTSVCGTRAEQQRRIRASTAVRAGVCREARVARSPRGIRAHLAADGARPSSRRTNGAGSDRVWPPLS